MRFSFKGDDDSDGHDNDGYNGDDDDDVDSVYDHLSSSPFTILESIYKAINPYLKR